LADEQRCFPPHVLLDFGNQGFFGIHISREYGGLELNTSDILRVIEQVAAIDLTLSVILVESIQGAHTVEKYATENMKNQYLNLLATGRMLTSGAMTESEAGSNPRGMKSIAAPDKEDGWLLQGSKRWVGMGASAGLIAIYVQQVDANNNWLGMSGFLVPQGANGLCIGEDSYSMGIRGFSKNSIYMDNLKVSPENLLGKIGEGMEIAQDNMMYIRLCLSAATVGAMKRCVQLIHRYAERRMIATGLLLDNPVTLVKLSEITAVIDAIDNFIYLISSFYDDKPSSVPEEVFVVSKILGSEYLGWVADASLQMLGARGYEAYCDISKIFRDARVFRIFEGPTEALNMYLGSKALIKNTELEFFISNTLNQKKLFEEIQENIAKINESCIINKSDLFVKPLQMIYWVQALVGELISYGLLLASIQYSLSKNKTDNLQRSLIWARSKYDDVVKRAMTFSSGEKVIAETDLIRDIVSEYSVQIGNIDQTRKGNHFAIDPLLQANTKTENNKTEFTSGDHLFSRKTVASENTDAQSSHVEKTVSYAHNFCHHLFEEQVKITPQAIAVVYHDEKITYEELNLKANKVAYYLKQAGIGPKQIVAIYFERSVEMIIALLGILKSGAAYLPLDYNYPEKTLKFMLDDSGAAMILSQKKLSCAALFDVKKVNYIEDILAISKDEHKANIATSISSDDVGYVIYTSGSTGQPKGVLLPHKALANLMNWHIDKINAKRNVLQFTTVNSDMSFMEIFSALSSGGTLVLISERERLEHLAFAKIVKKYAVEQLMLSVPFLKSLVDAKVDKNYFETVKEIIIAGEQLIVTPALVSFFNKLSSCKLLNYYGPSETHVVTAYEFPQRVSDWPDYPPIGQAIPNTKIVLLNEDNQLVPTGALGEIHIGGVCLAKGYVNKVELTNEKFVHDNWGNKQIDLLYKTGDYGKYLPDGNLVYLGRKDEQLKIRGYRIEPQEIEWHLIKFPAIKEAVVIAKKGLHAEKRLEAFIVVEKNLEDDFNNEIYSFLQDRLPVYMLPSVFNIVEKLPLTNSGKIDREALKEYDKGIIYSINKIIEPNTDTEKMMITIMEDIFKIRIGVNNSFFSVGGNSLLAMQVVSQLRDVFSIDIPAYKILSDPTIADTANYIDSMR